MDYTFRVTFNGLPVGLNSVDKIHAQSGTEAETLLTKYYERTYNLCPPKTITDAERGFGLELDLITICKPRKTARKCCVCGIRVAENVFYFLNLHGRNYSSHPLFFCNRSRVYIPMMTHSEQLYDAHIGFECLYQFMTRIELDRGLGSLSPTIQYKIDRWEDMFKSRGSERRLYIKHT